MRTLKTAFVVVGLLGVLYGAYVVLNKPGSLPFSFTSGGKSETAEADLPKIVDPDDAPAPVAVAPPRPLRADTASYNDPHDPGMMPAPPAPLPAPAPVYTPDQAGPPPSAGPGDYSVTDGNHGDPRVQPPTQPSGGPEFDTGEAARRRAATRFAATWKEAEQHLQRGHLADALRCLTPLHNSPELSSPDRDKVNDMLDRLAGTVVYAKQYHYLALPHKVLPGEKLAEIAGQNKLPWELLARINNIEDPNILFTGEELKVLPGPFAATIDLRTQELMLTVKGCYAGKFPITVGADPPPREGEFQVIRKMAPTDSSNATGSFVVDIGGGLTLFGDTGGANARGSIGLSPRDATDLYYIFTESKSPIVIRR